MILLTGATGTTGIEVVRELAHLGAKDVRAMVRNPARAATIVDVGFEVVEGDFDRPETLAVALEGAERALLLSAPDPRQVEQQGRFIEAARRAGVRHVVKVSAVGADANAAGGFGKWHGQTEDELKASGLAWTMLQPNFFMQNVLGQARSITAEGRVYQAAGEGRASFVDARDVAAVAAKALTEDGHEGKSYVVTGPEALSLHEVAEKISQAVGRKVTYVPVRPEEFRRGALSQGVPEWLVDALEILDELLASGRAAAVTDVVREVTGREPFTFDQFAQDYAQAFKG